MFILGKNFLQCLEFFCELRRKNPRNVEAFATFVIVIILFVILNATAFVWLAKGSSGNEAAMQIELLELHQQQRGM